MTTFTDLGLAASILKALEGENYVSPTPIQQQAIPVVLAGRDLMGIAQTGTGKTAAFALPILDRLSRDPRPAARNSCRVLVLSPTRELATQIADSFRTYGRNLRLTVQVVVGGVSYRPQVQALTRGVDILVATPGRLIDHIDERTFNVSATEVFVLDEADQMLDLGFVKPIRRIASGLSHKRQSLLFSATMPREIAELAKEFLKDPARVSVTPQATTVERIDQRIIQIESKKKRALLAELLADAAMARTLVFTRTKRGADRVAKYLEAAGISAAAIHGNKSQNQREAALDAFRKGKVRVMVATDIAARGIDVDGVSHVVNYELPEVPEAYVHRIGRTARAGASGKAISFCDASERDLLRDIERVTRQKIVTESRCNDASLVADTTAQADSGDRDRNSRGGRGQSSRNPRGNNASRPARAGYSAAAPRTTGGPDRQGAQPTRDRAPAGDSARGRSHDGNIAGVGFMQRDERQNAGGNANGRGGERNRGGFSAAKPAGGATRPAQRRPSRQDGAPR